MEGRCRAAPDLGRSRKSIFRNNSAGSSLASSRATGLKCGSGCCSGKIWGHLRQLTLKAWSACFYWERFFGAPPVALYSDFIRQRQLPMMLSAIASFAINASLIFIPGLPIFLSRVLLFLIGFAFSGQPLIFAVSCERVPSHMVGTVTGVVNMVVMLGGVVLQPLVGIILDWSWEGAYENGAPAYSLLDYRLALATIPLGMLVSFFRTFLIPANKARQGLS